jgi:putative permease
MKDVFQAWFKRTFSDPQVVILAILLFVGFAIVIFMGKMLAPLLASLVIAYLLEAVVEMLMRWGLPRFFSVMIVFFVFLVLLIFLLLGFLPLLSGQITQLVQELPNMIARGQEALMRLPELYPNMFSEEQVKELLATIRENLLQQGQALLSVSLSSIPSVITLIVYLVLVPLLVFFFLKDKEPILGWITRYLPKERKLAAQVWEEMDQQIGNYVRGKFLEILIVGVVTYVVFGLMGLRYSMLLGALVGLSVIVPYLGAAVVTIPVAFIGYFQWGWGSEFAYIMIAYGVIQALDGNLLVPLLFSEAVNLHPVAIIVAVLVFGGLWGVLGVFFAIPLATLVKAVLSAWPRGHEPPANAK